ncbi:MAG: DUF924 family protein [Hyphomicrobiaceae bacterium]
MIGPPTDGWAREVLTFWFREIQPDDWFTKCDATDELIRARFSQTHAFVAREPVGELVRDADTALGATIVLDQFSRNMFRNDPVAFATDEKARLLARRAIGRGFDRHLSNHRRVFFYLPFEHSETLSDQDVSVALFSALGDENFLRFAEKHRKVILAFGRYPHRNAVLNRTSTPPERAYLLQPGRGF